MRRFVPFLFGTALLATSVTTAAADLTKVSCRVPYQEFKAALLQATNQTRAAARTCGGQRYEKAAPLKWNGALQRAARDHSRDMAYNNFFSHTGSDGLKSWDRALAQGYVYRSIGENIAAGYATVASVQAGWVASAGHCRNIMNRTYTELGAACVSSANSDYRRYWTVVFGTRR